MDAVTDPPPPREPTTRAERKLLEDAKEHLGDERVLSVIRGQTFVSPIILPLLGPLLFIFGVRPRTVIVTEESVITVQESNWAQSKVVRLVSRYRSGSVPVKLSRLGVKIGDDQKIFAMLASLPALRDAAAVGSQADAA